MTENVQQDIAGNTPKYWLSLIRIFPYMDRIVSVSEIMSKYGKYGYDSTHIQENTDQTKRVFQHILRIERTGIGC